MEKVVTSIVSFPSSDKISHQDYHKELRQLGDLLSKSSPSNLIGSQGNDPLDVLDFSKHSLGVLHILYCPHFRIRVIFRMMTNLVKADRYIFTVAMHD